MPASPESPGAHYRRPGWFTRNVFNRTVARLTKSGFSVLGSRVLETRGRKTGQPRRVPVNLLEHRGDLYLVAPRGETEWVRNVRADGGRLVLILGRRRQEMVGSELPDSEKVTVLREYLRRWKAEVGVFFEAPTRPTTRSPASPRSTRCSCWPTPRQRSRTSRRRRSRRSSRAGRPSALGVTRASGCM